MTIRRLWNALRIAVRLGCPRCGERTVFRGLFSMHERCQVCRLIFEREPGYFIGAIYINYAVTAALLISGFLLLDAYADLSLTAQIATWSAVGVVFPLFFFRYSKSLWLAIDHLLSPEESRLEVIDGRRT